MRFLRGICPSRLVVGAVFCAIAASACGDEGSSDPGWADPCDTPMAGILGCPASHGPPPRSVATIEEACNRLLSCGIIAEERYTAIKNKDGKTTGYKTLKPSSLDYAWCVGRLRRPPTMPCLAEVGFGPEHVLATISCVMSTPCASLGLSFGQKLAPHTGRPELDLQTCPSGSKVWNATICDNGILRYQ